ncbi:MAG: hypothetical protein WBE44_13380 [Terriglobales bacterium]
MIDKYVGALILTILSVAACTVTTHPGKEANPTEEVVSVSACEIFSDPARYNHKLVKVTGTVSHGFESFFLSDQACAQFGDAIWLEYGGKQGSGTVFAGGPSSDRKRPSTLIVEGISTSIVDDAQFERLDALIRSKRSVTAAATIVGRYFSGELEKNNVTAHPFWDGYGHLYGYSLLVIQKVESVHSK